MCVHVFYFISSSTILKKQQNRFASKSLLMDKGETKNGRGDKKR
jgi:hypothetical protein